MRRLLLLAAGVLAIGASSAHATTIDVTVADDAIADDGRCSLREAVRSANLDAAPFNTPGECAAGNLADTINVPAGTFKLTIPGADEQALSGDLDVLAGLTINGAGAASTIIDGNRIDRVLDVKSGVSVTLQSLTITGGKAADSAAGGDDLHGGDGNGLSATGGDAFHADDGGGIRSLGGLTIIDCAITGNEAGSGGRGGNAVAPFGTTGDSLTSGGVGGNATGGRGGAGGRGGGIFSQGSLTLLRVRIEGNKAGDGGDGGSATSGQGGAGNGGGRGGTASGGPAGNPGSGGGIQAIGSSILTIQQSVIADNTAGSGGNGGAATGHDGGAGYNTGGTGGIAIGGDATDGADGGGIVAGSSGSMSGTLFSGNHAGDGGAGGTATAGRGGALITSTGDGGFGGEADGGSGGAGGEGGGLWLGGSVTITNATFDGNGSGAGGNAGAGTGGKGGNTIDASGMTGSGGNGTGGDGGRGGDGGAIHASGPLIVVHATITSNGLGASKPGGSGTGGAAGNAAGSGGTAGSGTNGASSVLPADSAIARETNSASVSASIFAGNSTPACHSGIAGDTNISLADPSCVGANADPLLGPLADNGGPTLTRRPGDGSPAIDSGPAQGCPETDQRGAVRPSGAACDIGAYERAAPIPVITQAAATVAGTVNPNARASTAHFEYGTTNAYGTSTPDIAVPAGVEAVPVGADLTGLAPSTTYHVRLVATNADGTNASSDASFTTGAQGGGGGGADTTKPVILSASVKPKTFRRRRGTTFRYKLSEAAKVVFTIQRKKGKRYVRATRLSKSSKAGANKRRFKTRKLKPGRYRATLVATDASGNRSKAKRLTFRIKR